MKIGAAWIGKPRRKPFNQMNQKRTRHRTAEKPLGLSALAALLAGLALGAALQSFVPTALEPEMQSRVTAFLSAEPDSFFEMLRTCLSPSLGLGLLILYLGASPLGTPGIAALLCLRGCGLGAIAVYLASLGKTGAAFYFACLFPAKTQQLCGLFLLSRRAIAMSSYTKSCLRQGSQKVESMTRRYLAACLPPLVLLLAAAVLDVLLQQKVSPSFASLFG